jgi:hypothetical protein
MPAYAAAAVPSVAAIITAAEAWTPTDFQTAPISAKPNAYAKPATGNATIQRVTIEILDMANLPLS